MAACLFLQRGSPNPKQTGPTESERSGRRRPLAPSFARSGDSAGLIETQSWVGAHRLAVPWTLQSARQMVLRLHLVHFQGGGAHHLMGTPLPRGCADVAPRGLPSRLLALCHCLLCSPGPQLPCASQTASRGPHQSVWAERSAGSWEMSGDESELAGGKAWRRPVTLRVSVLNQQRRKTSSEGFSMATTLGSDLSASF